MEIKKSPKADLERGKGLSLLLGLVVAISVLFVAFEWRSAAEVHQVDEKLDMALVDDVMNVQDEQKPEEPEPEQPQQQEVVVQLPEEFKVVDNETKVADLSFVAPEENKPTPPPAPVGPAPEPEEADEIVEFAEEQAQFEGGEDALRKYLAEHVRYPEIAQENGIQGRVVVGFVVEKDGRATQIKILRSVDVALDKEAMRVVSEMPKWKPGKQQGKPVRVRFQLPVVFRLQ